MSFSNGLGEMAQNGIRRIGIRRNGRTPKIDIILIKCLRVSKGYGPHVCVRCFWTDNGMLMEGLALSQEDKPQTHSSQRKIARRKVILKVGEVVCGLSSFGWERGPQLRWCNCRACAHCVDDHSRCRSILQVTSIFLKFSLRQHSIVCPKTSYTNVWLRNHCSIVDSQAFHQMSIFNGKIRGKTHYLQTCKYDVRMTSPVAIFNFYINGILYSS